MARKQKRFREIKLEFGDWYEDLPNNIDNTPPENLLGSRSKKLPIEKYSPCYMMEMFGAGVREPTMRAKQHIPQNEAGLYGTLQLTNETRKIDDQNLDKEAVIWDENGDARLPVPDTRYPPWRCICQIKTTRLNQTITLGTGWLAAPRIVVTAGHCLYATDGGQPSVVTITAGMYHGQAPFPPQQGVKLLVHDRWRYDFEDEYDYGLIVLPDTLIARQTGWFGTTALQDSHFKNLAVTSGGYPKDWRNSTVQVMADGRIVGVEEKYLYHSIDTHVGQSGAPVFHTDLEGRRTVVGIHTDKYSDQSNRAMRLTNTIFNQIEMANKKYPR